MPEILYAPSREQVMTTNAWAFLLWLRTARGIALADWTALQAWSARQPEAFTEAVGRFGGPRAETLLFMDLRPDDRLLETASEGADIWARAAEVSASVLVAPSALIADAAFRHPHRPNLSALRTIVATGGPMSPEARRRIYTWVKADVMLLACTGDTFWGNPLEPVLAQPPATPAFFSGGRGSPPPTLQAPPSR